MSRDTGSSLPSDTSMGILANAATNLPVSTLSLHGAIGAVSRFRVMPALGTIGNFAANPPLSDALDSLVRKRSQSHANRWFPEATPPIPQPTYDPSRQRSQS